MGRLRHTGCGLWLSGLALAAAAQGAAGPGAGIYACTDAQGRRINSDRPIASCADREQRILGPTGVERARVGPVLTEQERLQQAENQRRQLREQQLAQEARRRDAALLSRYPDAQAHEQERRTQHAPFDALQEMGRQRLKNLQDTRAGLLRELEFYQNDVSKAPSQLRTALQDTERAVLEQQRYMAATQADRQRVTQRLDEELQRLQVLWRARAAAGEAAAASAASSAPSAVPGARATP